MGRRVVTVPALPRVLPLTPYQLLPELPCGCGPPGLRPVSSSFPTCVPDAFPLPFLPGAHPPLRGLRLSLLSPPSTDSLSFPPRAVILGDAQPD